MRSKSPPRSSVSTSRVGLITRERVQNRPTRRKCEQQVRPCMSAKTKQTLRFCTRYRSKSPIACSLEPCADVYMRVCHNWTETQEGNTNDCSCDHVLEKTRVSTSLTDSDCALSASGTSQVLCPQLRSQRRHFASVPFAFREQRLPRARGGFQTIA